MTRAIDIFEIEEFCEAQSILASSIGESVLSGVKQLHEKKEIEPFIREILGNPDETPHCPTELADIITHVHIRGTKVLAAFVLKGRSFKDIKGSDVGYQFFKLRRIPGLKLIVFGAVGNIHDDPTTMFIQTAQDGNYDYLIMNSVELARLFISYRKICFEDGTSFNERGTCRNGHERQIQIEEVTEEQISYQILDQSDLSHAGAKRYRAVVLLQHKYPSDTIKTIINEATEKLKQSNYYRNEQTKTFWGAKPAQVVYLFVAADYNDINNSNWVCRASWIDENLPETFKPTALSGNDKIQDIEIKWEESYEETKKFYEQHTTSKEETMNLNRATTQQMISSANKAIKLFQLYQKNELLEKDLISAMQDMESEVNDLYNKSNDFPFPPPDCADYDDACQNLYGTVKDVFLYFSQKGLQTWDAKNRDWLMQETINRVREDQKKIEFEENKIK